MRRDGQGADMATADFRRTVLGECPPGHDPADFSATVESRLSEMRALLARMQPSSDAEALQALRAAFPEASLSTRVAAIAARHG